MFGYVFLFFSHEHCPVHVHVWGYGGDAKLVWDGEGFRLEESNGIKANDLQRIERAVQENADLILSRWYEFFGYIGQDEDHEDLV